MSESTDITPLMEDYIVLQRLLKEGDTSNALQLSEELLTRSRSISERNHYYEARIRMERALIGAVEDDTNGVYFGKDAEVSLLRKVLC